MDADARRLTKFTQRLDSLPLLKKQVFVVEVFQNQRRHDHKWHRKYLRAVPTFSCRDGSASCARFPKHLAPPPGYDWVDRWRPCLKGSCDANGWTYASSFDHLVHDLDTSAAARDTDSVRRRRWVRTLECRVLSFPWKDERLGVSLVEPPDLSRQTCVQVHSRAPLPMYLLPVGATHATAVKYASKDDLRIHAMLSKGDLLLRVNDVDVSTMPFDQVVGVLEDAFEAASMCFLRFAAASGQIRIHACTRAARKCHLAPGFRLVGLNGRSVQHLRLVDVESILRQAPRNACVLRFHEGSSDWRSGLPQPYALVQRNVLCVKERELKPHVSVPCVGPDATASTAAPHRWLSLGSRVSALFALSS
ncbi:hypothetical protein H310_06442 [Aphanomyces invadans]|uniref:Peroxin/Ferlin domain-containing protein n=1 Tax=Aphanomyces invadans TaxID=157072 RepID=A0A024U6Q0_9STRA|nr:hypothetical protein H310_06442 [Aphanomyces invadans]ETW01880.1 hypothetical protein H310_06442 [Aphanomyces invadans]|eukprot:XP_008869728.1 hypothetical protein H310_06442 [Aphanomyces invadans]